MMGRLEAGQERLFYKFRLEDQVPANHLLRKLDALLELDTVRKQLEPFYSEIGRPSVDPELMIRMLLIGYCYSIRSERRLCDEVRFNLGSLGGQQVVPLEPPQPAPRARDREPSSREENMTWADWPTAPVSTRPLARTRS